MGRRSSADAKWLQQVRCLQAVLVSVRLCWQAAGGLAHAVRLLQACPALLPAQPLQPGSRLGEAAARRRCPPPALPCRAVLALHCRLSFRPPCPSSRCGAAVPRRIAWQQCRCCCRTARPPTCSLWMACWRWSARREVRATLLLLLIVAAIRVLGGLRERVGGAAAGGGHCALPACLQQSCSAGVLPQPRTPARPAWLAQRAQGSDTIQTTQPGRSLPIFPPAGARAVVGSAMDALKELFTTVLLPDRKLR